MVGVGIISQKRASTRQTPCEGSKMWRLDAKPRILKDGDSLLCHRCLNTHHTNSYRIILEQRLEGVKLELHELILIHI